MTMVKHLFVLLPHSRLQSYNQKFKTCSDWTGNNSCRGLFWECYVPFKHGDIIKDPELQLLKKWYQRVTLKVTALLSAWIIYSTPTTGHSSRIPYPCTTWAIMSIVNHFTQLDYSQRHFSLASVCIPRTARAVNICSSQKCGRLKWRQMCWYRWSDTITSRQEMERVRWSRYT